MKNRNFQKCRKCLSPTRTLIPPLSVLNKFSGRHGSNHVNPWCFNSALTKRYRNPLDRTKVMNQNLSPLLIFSFRPKFRFDAPVNEKFACTILDTMKGRLYQQFLVTTTGLDRTTFIPQQIFWQPSVAPNHPLMFWLEIDEASSQSTGSIPSCDRKRVIMSRIFFSTKILLRPPAGERIACSIPPPTTGNRLYKPVCFDLEPFPQLADGGCEAFYASKKHNSATNAK